MDNEIKKAFLERWNVPFYRALMISFVLWNWEALVILIYPQSDWGILLRLKWIFDNLYNDWWEHLYYSLGPIATAALAVAVIPRWTNWLDKYSYEAFVINKNQRERIDERLINKQLEVARLSGMLTSEVQRRTDLESQLAKVTKSFTDTFDALRAARDESDRYLDMIVRYDNDILGVLLDLKEGVDIEDHNGKEMAINLGLIQKMSFDNYAMTPSGSEVLKRREAAMS